MGEFIALLESQQNTNNQAVQKQCQPYLWWVYHFLGCHKLLIIPSELRATSYYVMALTGIQSCHSLPWPDTEFSTLVLEHARWCADKYKSILMDITEPSLCPQDHFVEDQMWKWDEGIAYLKSNQAKMISCTVTIHNEYNYETLMYIKHGMVTSICVLPCVNEIRLLLDSHSVSDRYYYMIWIFLFLLLWLHVVSKNSEVQWLLHPLGQSRRFRKKKKLLH